MQSWLWLGWGDLTTGANRAISVLLALTWPSCPHGSQGAICKTRSKERDFLHRKHWYNNLSPHFFHDYFFQVIFKNVTQHRRCWSPTDNTLLLWELNMPSHRFAFCPLTSSFSARRPDSSFPDHLTSLRGIHESSAELLENPGAPGLPWPTCLFHQWLPADLWITAAVRLALTYYSCITSYQSFSQATQWRRSL